MNNHKRSRHSNVGSYGVKMIVRLFSEESRGMSSDSQLVEGVPFWRNLNPAPMRGNLLNSY